jgi:hypothetical protein
MGDLIFHGLYTSFTQKEWEIENINIHCIDMLEIFDCALSLKLELELMFEFGNLQFK